MTQPGQNRGYLHGAAILAAAVAIVKIIGAVFRILLGNIVGAEGLGIFGVTHGIYALLLAVSTAGLPVALSKMVASANALGRPLQVRRVFTISRNTFLILGLVSFLIMALFHQQLAALSGSPSTAYPILALSPAVLFVCLISAYRGFFQGHSHMLPTSVSQVIEAAGRLFLGLGLAWFLNHQGFPLPISVAGAIFGITVGTFFSYLYLFFTKRKIGQSKTKDALDTPDSNRRIFRNLLNIAIPLTLGVSVFSIVTIIDNAVILRRLQSVGYDYEMARNFYGTYFMTTPLFNLPSSFIIPLTVALIPAISAFLARGDHLSAKRTSESGLRMTCLLALPASVGLTVLASPIMHVLYNDFAPQGPGLLAYMGVAAFFLCFFQATNCVLQAYGFQRYTVYTLTIGGIIKIALNWFLLADPRFGIYGAAISTVACYMAICLINMALVKWRIPSSPSFFKVFTKPVLCTAVMGGAAWASYGLFYRLTAVLVGGLDLPRRLFLAVPLTGAIVLSVATYLFLIIAFKALRLEDMRMLPKGEKLAKILRIR